MRVDECSSYVSEVCYKGAWGPNFPTCQVSTGLSSSLTTKLESWFWSVKGGKDGAWFVHFRAPSTWGNLAYSFQGCFFLENLRKPRENGRFLERTVVEKNGESNPRFIVGIREAPKAISKQVSLVAYRSWTLWGWFWGAPPFMLSGDIPFEVEKEMPSVRKGMRQAMHNYGFGQFQLYFPFGGAWGCLWRGIIGKLDLRQTLPDSLNNLS